MRAWLSVGAWADWNPWARCSESGEDAEVQSRGGRSFKILQASVVRSGGSLEGTGWVVTAALVRTDFAKAQFRD
jgi:hypothetical protein